MKQVWKSLTINADSKEEAKKAELCLSRNSKVRNVVRDESKVTYEQLTWVDGCYDDESEDD